jgi:hypothetical protein
LKHIYGVANIVEENVIEFLIRRESLLELLLVWESDREFEGRISLLRDFNNLSADVNTLALTWPDNGQKIARVAAN